MSILQTIAPITLFSTMLLIGCASPLKPQPESFVEITPPPIKKHFVSVAQGKESLNKQLKSWKSVKYRFGGLNKRGVDCSGFIYMTFLEQYGIKLPRNTRSQVKMGKAVKRHELQLGDLVFFRVNRNVRHVGIYLKDDKFMHVSARKGVTTSSLNNSYWVNKYWTARRLKPVSLKQDS